MKPETTYLLLYVEDTRRSRDFYADLFGLQAIEASEGFVLFILDGGLRLGLWARRAVTPAAGMTGGGTELALAVGEAAAVDTLHADWASRGLPILQPPATLEFGRTFVAADPDGHRLRIFAPG